MPRVAATLNDETLVADLFHPNRVFIAGSRVLLLCVDFKRKPAAADSFLRGPRRRFLPRRPWWMMRERHATRFPGRQSVLVRVKQRSTRRCFTDVWCVTVQSETSGKRPVKTHKKIFKIGIKYWDNNKQHFCTRDTDTVQMAREVTRVRMGRKTLQPLILSSGDLRLTTWMEDFTDNSATSRLWFYRADPKRTISVCSLLTSVLSRVISSTMFKKSCSSLLLGKRSLSSSRLCLVTLLLA